MDCFSINSICIYREGLTMSEEMKTPEPVKLTSKSVGFRTVEGHFVFAYETIRGDIIFKFVNNLGKETSIMLCVNSQDAVMAAIKEIRNPIKKYTTEYNYPKEDELFQAS